MQRNNPFNPSFGGRPQYFFGRHRELTLVSEALGNQNSPYRVLFFTGNRGCGKTALLERLSQLAADARWLTVDVHSANASEAIVRKLVGGTARATERAIGPSVGAAGLSLSIGHVAKTVSVEYDALDLSDILLEACRSLKRHEGIFITVDEIQKIPEADMENLCAAVQMSLRKGMPVALAMAGLPGAKEQVSSYKGCTFMQRVTDMRLDSLLVDETFEAFRRLTGLLSNCEVADGAIEELARYSQGYPYLMQLIGFHTVEALDSSLPVGADVIDCGLVGFAKYAAYDAYRTNVLDPVVRSLSREQHVYLRTMASCMDADGRSGTGDVARLMEKTPQQLSSTRQRLLFKRLIAEDGHGFVRYNLPRMRQYFTDPLERAADQGSNVWKHE